jgi:hypothetical protein
MAVQVMALAQPARMVSASRIYLRYVLDDGSSLQLQDTGNIVAGMLAGMLGKDEVNCGPHQFDGTMFLTC